jgi:hypothetical protein
VGGLGSGAWEKHNHQMVGSCCEIDANHLSACGCLEPGQSSLRLLAHEPPTILSSSSTCAPNWGGCTCLGTVLSTTPMLAPFMHALVGIVTLAKRKTADFLTRIR